ncbi:ABC transporter permease [Jeotgalicoccus halotolerans]|uniref:ABC transporter permease n=1 Tax=Jeotgalicoccus nanhaiensis TaxID=568603 RepID=A0ABR9Y098_9STAP|nr:ABC transporter permease [Jeotgalicoccus nanhaiensis]MBF0754567.1 ABC transporter permease [Jeotgalicoccus nanhaiensis]TFU61087.1 ABC transporter permease [Jeotgalicoccus nanhaiensis]
MSNLLQAEIFKLKHNKSFWVLLIISAALSSLMHYLVVSEWWMLTNTPFEAAGIPEMNALSMFILPLFFNLMIGTLAAFYISTEFGSTGVIKNQIISGKHRSLIYFAKYVVYTAAAVILTVIIPVGSGLILKLIISGSIFNGDHLIYLLTSFGLFTLQLAGYTAIITLIAIMTGDSGKTIIFSIALTLIMFVIDQIPMSDLISKLYNYSIFHQFGTVMNPEMTAGDIVTAVSTGVISTVVMLLIGMYVFGKKEIK